MEYTLTPIGYVHSVIKTRDQAPKQGTEGAPSAEISILPEYRDALDGMEPGSRLILLTWFHKSDRTYLRVHPRGNVNTPKRGIFSTRSPDRPNPIGLHEVTLTRITNLSLEVTPLEALDGTPVVDIKPAI